MIALLIFIPQTVGSKFVRVESASDLDNAFRVGDIYMKDARRHSGHAAYEIEDSLRPHRRCSSLVNNKLLLSQNLYVR